MMPPNSWEIDARENAMFWRVLEVVLLVMVFGLAYMLSDFIGWAGD